MNVRIGPVIGVVGGSGGVGASSFAAALAVACGASTLVDVDVDGGGVDVLLGLEDAPGARWSGLRLAGGELSAQVLRSGLCAWGRCAVLGADVAELAPEAVAQVLEVAAFGGPVVVDLPRRDCPERAAAVAMCDLTVVVARADVSGLVAAHGVVSALAEVPVGVVVRPAAVPAVDAARLAGAEFLGELPTVRHLEPARPARPTLRLAAGVVAGVRQRRAA